MQPASLYAHVNPPSVDGVTDKGWDHRTYYNNMFVTNVTLWTTAPMRPFLEYIDRQGGIYTNRWGDAPIHTVAVGLFLKSEQIHTFMDWNYYHE